MNFLTLFARNLRRGPYTERFPFGPPAPARKRLRGRIEFEAKLCEGCLLCEKLCPSGAIRFSRTAAGLAFDCWHSTCVFCGTCAFYCPSGSIRQTTDWSLAHVEAEMFAVAEHGLIPTIVCAECGGKGLDTAPNVAKVRPPLSDEEYAQLRRRCPKCRNKFLRNRGKTS
jgi:formate hydrogenlyase subunit 6/NADH:ubiquinone oxidoreductase subunit I